VDRYPLHIGIAFLLFLGTCWGATLPSVAVGTCKPNLHSYSTIQDAVANVAAGGTILVCPGAYPEQVLINKPLTMKGVSSGDAAASTITSPQGGLKQSTVDHLGNAWAAQVLVQSTAGPVDISDLSVDGAKNGISGSCPGLNVVGIYYQEASGVIDRAATRNQTTPCFHDAGIFLESFGPASQAVTVENNSVRGFDGSGIYADTDSTAPTLTLTIASNLVTGEVGTATGMALGNIKGTVKSNIVERMFYGIEVFHATMTVTSNTVTGDGGSGAPFLIYRDGSTLMGNKLDAAGATGAIFGDAGTSIFKSNAVFNFSLAVSGCSGSFPPPSGYTVSGNTMTDGTNGLRMTKSNTTAPNTYSSVTTPVSSCT
jgi:hypothetical protein